MNKTLQITASISASVPTAKGLKFFQYTRTSSNRVRNPAAQHPDHE